MTRKKSQNVQNVKIIEFGDYIIWNHHEECIQIGTNMHGIGLEFWETQNGIDGETNGRVQSINIYCWRITRYALYVDYE